MSEILLFLAIGPRY